MTRKRVRYQASDAENSEQRFRETGDIMMLVLAIGRQPHAPPEWAVEVCTDIYEHVSGLHAVGANPSKVGEILDEVWRYFLAHPDDLQRDDKGRIIANKGPSVRKAIIHAIGTIEGENESRPTFEAKLRSVQRAWNLEQRSDRIEDDDYELFDGLKSTARFYRIFEEWGAEEYGGITSRDAVKALFRSAKEP